MGRPLGGRVRHQFKDRSDHSNRAPFPVRPPSIWENELADLETKIEHARQRLRDLHAQAQKQKRRDETRRKIIYGAALQEHLGQLEASKREATLAWLHKRITRPSDRRFLGLPDALKNGDPEKKA